MKAHDRKIIDEFIKETMSGLSRLECAACGRVNGFDLYMVRNRVWKEAGLKRNEFCCLDCLSKRLGRDLSIGDFNLKTPLNRPLVFGYLMGRLESRRTDGCAAFPVKIPGLPRLARSRAGSRKTGKP